MNEQEREARLIGWQVVATDGERETVVLACTDSQDVANSVRDTYNWGTRFTGRTADCRSFPLPTLTRNPLRKVE